MASALVRAQEAARVARGKVRSMSGASAGAKDALVGNAGAFAAGFVDQTANLKLPDMQLRPSFGVGIATVAIGAAMGSGNLITFGGGMFAPLIAEFGSMAASNLFGSDQSTAG
jgi:hypothetical protein